MSGFGTRLKNALVARNLSVPEFAERYKLDKTSLYAYLRGDKNPSADAFEKLAAAGIDLSWLCTGEIGPGILAHGANPTLQPLTGVVAEDYDFALALLKRVGKIWGEIKITSSHPYYTEVTCIWEIMLRVSKKADEVADQIRVIKSDRGIGFVADFVIRMVLNEEQEKFEALLSSIDVAAPDRQNG
jgi:transcriptional regulator with XRE-family HTH domain